MLAQNLTLPNQYQNPHIQIQNDKIRFSFSSSSKNDNNNTNRNSISTSSNYGGGFQTFNIHPLSHLSTFTNALEEQSTLSSPKSTDQSASKTFRRYSELNGPLNTRRRSCLVEACQHKSFNGPYCPNHNNYYIQTNSLRKSAISHSTRTSLSLTIQQPLFKIFIDKEEIINNLPQDNKNIINHSTVFLEEKITIQEPLASTSSINSNNDINKPIIICADLLPANRSSIYRNSIVMKSRSSQSKSRKSFNNNNNNNNNNVPSVPNNNLALPPSSLELRRKSRNSRPVTMVNFYNSINTATSNTTNNNQSINPEHIATNSKDQEKKEITNKTLNTPYTPLTHNNEIIMDNVSITTRPRFFSDDHEHKESIIMNNHVNNALNVNVGISNNINKDMKKNNLNPTPAQRDVDINKNIYSWSEISTHNHSESCWVVVKGLVYDITPFLADHPAGDKIILRLSAGKDASDHWEHHSKRAKNKWTKTCIGKLEGYNDKQCSIM